MFTPTVQELAADNAFRITSLASCTFWAKVEAQAIADGNLEVGVRHLDGSLALSADRLLQEATCPWPPAGTKVNLFVLGEHLQKKFPAKAYQFASPLALQARLGGGVARNPIVGGELAISPLSHVAFRTPYKFVNGNTTVGEGSPRHGTNTSGKTSPNWRESQAEQYPLQK